MEIKYDNNKLAPYGTDGRLFRTDVSANFKVKWQKTRAKYQTVRPE